MIWHPLVRPTCEGATTESNCKDIEIIRGLPTHVKNPAWGGEEDQVNSEFFPNPERLAVINEMVEKNISLVFHKVEVYIDLWPTVAFLSDDLINEGMLALTKAIHKLVELNAPKGGGNPTAFIGQRIIWSLANLIENDEKQQILPEVSEWLLNKQTYRGYEKPVVCELNGVITHYASVTDAVNQTGHRERDIRQWCHGACKNQDGSEWYFNHRPPRRPVIDPLSMIELRDLLSATCQTPEDVIVIEMRERGCTDQEIADRLDISRTAVRLQRHELLQRYDALVKANL